MSSDNVKSHSSWKFDLIDVLVRELPGTPFRVATVLLQYADGKTRAIYPSQATLAHKLHISIKSVERSIRKLVADGWLRKHRPHRHRSNRYAFCEDRIAAAKLEHERKDLEWRLARDQTNLSSPRANSTPKNVGSSTGNSEGPDPTDMTVKHPEGTTSVKHLEIPGAEQNHVKVVAKKNAASINSQPSAGRGNYGASRSKQEDNRPGLRMSKAEIKNYLDNL